MTNLQLQVSASFSYQYKPLPKYSKKNSKQLPLAEITDIFKLYKIFVDILKYHSCSLIFQNLKILLLTVFII